MKEKEKKKLDLSRVIRVADITVCFVVSCGHKLMFDCLREFGLIVCVFLFLPSGKQCFRSISV